MTGHSPAERSYHPSGFFCLRTHLLPFDTLREWSGAGRLREGLQDLVRRPEVREALFVASPALDEVIDLWIRAPETDQGRRAERSLVKYLSRMAARPTPFGLFAGVASGEVGATTRFSVAPPNECRRHTRLDNEFLFALAEAVTKDAEVRARARYFPNDSLAFTAGHGRYTEARVEGESHGFHLVGVPEAPELRAVLALASRGATRAELAQTLVDSETTIGETEQYIDEMIESQLLLPDIGLQVTGSAPALALAQQIDGIPAVRRVTEGLRAACDSLAQIDHHGLGNEPARYRAIATGLEALPAKVTLARLFQVDLVRPEAGTLGPGVVAEMRRGIELMHRITPTPIDQTLSRFKQAFVERYEGREVPLLEALDEEVGLGGDLWPGSDPSPLLKNLPLESEKAPTMTWDARARWMAHCAGESLRRGDLEWSLSAQDLERLAAPAPGSLPDSLAVMATIGAESEAAIDRGDFSLRLHHVEGPSGARLLGRFCHVDPQLSHQVRSHLREEEASEPAAVYAELVHLGEGRIGNILLRPVLREYEITYLGRSGAPFERQIPVSDLLVRVTEGRITLRSARLNREVIPRLTSAHNFGNSLAPYRFLCHLQSQGCVSGLWWTWGGLEALPFLPRVRSGRLVLALARWRIDKGTTREFTRGSEVDRARTWQAWRTAHRLPRWIALKEHDNRLPIDLDNPLSVDCLLHEFNSEEDAILEELWPTPDQLVARGPEGAYHHELIVPFVRIPSVAAVPRLGPSMALGNPVTRRFPPGSEWLYVKLYVGPAMADDLLREIVGPVSRRLIQAGTVKRWFFVRYNDPDFHLRWRLAGATDRLMQRAWPEIQGALEEALRTSTVRRLQVDTYEREVERYGGAEAALLAEELFHADSEAVVELLELLEPGDAGLDERWRLALRGADQLLDDVGLTLPEKLRVIEERAKHFGSVPEPDATLRHQLTARFRELRADLEQLLDRAKDGESLPLPGFGVLNGRSERLRTICASLRALNESGRLEGRLTDIAGSYIHMHLNRVLRGAPNDHEVVVYDFLRRLYRSKAARSRKG